uniref:COG1470 family protein n=1 Tax=Pontiella sp. TaxID=2837462 RepID=UPI003565420F
MKQVFLILAAMAVGVSHAGLRMPVGSDDFSDWKGIHHAGSNEAEVISGKPVSYVYSNQNRIYPNLKREFEGDAADWYGYAGLSFDIFLEHPSAAEVTVTFKADPADHMELNPASTARALVSGGGWQSVYLPWDLFDVNIGQQGNALQAVKELEITVASSENEKLKIRKVEVTRGENVALESAIRGLTAEAGGTVEYELKVGNTTDETQGVQLHIERVGWESMIVAVEPAVFELAPGEVQNVRVEVALPASLPYGAREKQVIKAIPNGEGSLAETIDFFTAVAVPTPNIVFTADQWQGVKDKVARYAWAKEELAAYEKRASKWKVPRAKPVNPEHPRQALFHKSVADELKVCGAAYRLTGNEDYAAKVIDLLRQVSDPEKGYPVTEQISGDGFVHEGVIFQGLARAYDMVRDSAQ